MCCYKFLLDGCFCGTWSSGFEQVGNCEFVAEPVVTRDCHIHGVGAWDFHTAGTVWRPFSL